MICYVYKSLAKADTYVFLRDADGFDCLPPTLSQSLGKLEFEMEIELSAERRLARESASAVMAHLADAGFHLQLPPPLVVLGPAARDGGSSDGRPY